MYRILCMNTQYFIYVYTEFHLCMHDTLYAIIHTYLNNVSIVPPGQRVPTMISGKSLPSFRAYDSSARAGGFVGDRFLTGTFYYVSLFSWRYIKYTRFYGYEFYP